MSKLGSNNVSNKNDGNFEIERYFLKCRYCNSSVPLQSLQIRRERFILNEV